MSSYFMFKHMRLKTNIHDNIAVATQRNSNIIYCNTPVTTENASNLGNDLMLKGYIDRWFCMSTCSERNEIPYRCILQKLKYRY